MPESEPTATTTTGSDFAALTPETQAIWEQNAGFWDDQMGEGNEFQRILIAPAAERLLGLRAGERVVEAACGNGVFSRRMAALGAQVVASDFSPTFVARARARAADQPYADRVSFHVADATDEAQLLALGDRASFDAAYCGMAFMDMTTIEPLLRAFHLLLKPEGRFVFSLAHPCFNSGTFRLGIEEEDRAGEIVTTRYVRIAAYTQPQAARGLGILGQPAPHYYFHRSLSDLFGACFRAGFALDGMEEPTFPATSSSPRPLSWANYTDIPPVLVARLRVM
jgi:SAM-dependent methyltransferase